MSDARTVDDVLKAFEDPLSWVSRAQMAKYIVELETRLATLDAERAGVVTEAAASVLAERVRQRTAEGWTEAHDDMHRREELANAAACYAMSPKLVAVRENERRSSLRTLSWPWHASWWKPSPDDRRRELVKAGALILAEIERLDRAALHPTTPEASDGE